MMQVEVESDAMINHDLLLHWHLEAREAVLILTHCLMPLPCRTRQILNLVNIDVKEEMVGSPKDSSENEVVQKDTLE